MWLIGVSSSSELRGLVDKSLLEPMPDNRCYQCQPLEVATQVEDFILWKGGGAGASRHG